MNAYSSIPFKNPHLSSAATFEDTTEAPHEEGKPLFQKELPTGLLSFAAPERWRKVHVDDIIKTHISTDGHLYLDEILLRKHHPNLVFEKAHKALKKDHFFALRIVTAENIKNKLEHRLSPTFITLYYPLHFFFRRVLPKLKGFRKVCRVLQFPVDVSKAEIMGRLIYEGFSIVDVQEHPNETVIVTQRHPTTNPSLSKPPSSEGILFRMTRIGKEAKKITIYKFRSMHPYAEYVQEYIHAHHGLDEGGKFKDDFRVSTGGRIIRKYWIDELPMLINVIKGDLKLIGVRPISEHYFNLYPEYLKTLRVQTKPGLLPPFYADMPKTFEEIIQSEIAYLEAYQKAPFRTDLHYFLKIAGNIVFKRARSK